MGLVGLARGRKGKRWGVDAAGSVTRLLRGAGSERKQGGGGGEEGGGGLGSERKEGGVQGPGGRPGVGLQRTEGGRSRVRWSGSRTYSRVQAGEDGEVDRHDVVLQRGGGMRQKGLA